MSDENWHFFSSHVRFSSNPDGDFVVFGAIERDSEFWHNVLHNLRNKQGVFRYRAKSKRDIDFPSVTDHWIFVGNPPWWHILLWSHDRHSDIPENTECYTYLYEYEGAQT